DANNVYLDLVLNFAIPGGLGGNQANVGNALTNFFNSTGGIPLAFAALTPAGLSQVSGETATGSQQTTVDVMTQFMGVMTDPFIGGRGDTPAAPGATPFTEANIGRGAGREAYAMITKAGAAIPFTQRWSVWAAGYGGSQTTDGNGGLGTSTATSRIYGTAVGADYRFSANTLAGFALAGGGTSFGVNGFGGGRSDLFQAGAFLRHTVGPAYLSAALAYGWQDITTDRTVTVAGVDQLRAKFNANAWSGRAEGGYRYITPLMGLTPYAAGQFVTFELPNYAETVVSGANTFALGYAARSVTATRSEFGLRADRSFAMQDAILTLRGRAAWAHNFNPDRSITPTFQTL
ncbi:MAG: autotransporter outer membrane beta-barrel domain-containing protein, partial [Hyphomicrobium sp.]|nr:autotransporter outer membrane beta-barrel domain-containing protein [Hyphomicrobium sp.]